MNGSPSPRSTLTPESSPEEVRAAWAAACGLVGEHCDDDYAVLDGYDDAGDIVADYGIRSARGFRFLYRKLGWRVSRG